MDKVRANAYYKEKVPIYLFQSPWIRFALAHFQVGEQVRFVSIPVDKVRACKVLCVAFPRACSFQSPWIRFAHSRDPKHP